MSADDRPQHATSSDPSAEPEVTPRYFSEEAGASRTLFAPRTQTHPGALPSRTDLDMFVEICKFARNLGTISPLKDMIGARIHPRGAGLQLTRDVLPDSAGNEPRPRGRDRQPAAWCVSVPAPPSSRC